MSALVERRERPNYDFSDRLFPVSRAAEKRYCQILLPHHKIYICLFHVPDSEGQHLNPRFKVSFHKKENTLKFERFSKVNSKEGY